MARHRAPRRAPRRVSRSTAAIAGGCATAVAGLALLLAPGAPIAARSGSVLDAPSASASAGRSSTGESAAASTTGPAAEPSTEPTTTPATGSATGAVPPEAAPGVVVRAAVPAQPRVPVPVLVGFVPDRLVVEALGVDAALITTLVGPDGALVPPENPADLGWWRGVRPGTGRGSVVVAGHVDSSRFGQGPLARLVDLAPGDRAVVTGPDGARAEYVVRGIETYPKESLPAADLFSTEGDERLVLVTCGGRFDRRLGSWDSNIVAVLDPAPLA